MPDGIANRTIEFSDKMEAVAAEISVLGGILLVNSLMRQTTRLSVMDFSKPFHRAVFAAMLELEENRERIDPVLIVEIMKIQPGYDSLWTVSSVTGLTYGLPAFEDIRDYVRIVKESASVVFAVREAEKLADLLASRRIGLKEFTLRLSKLESELRSNYAEETDSFKPLSEIFQKEVLPTLDAYFREEKSEFLISTGFDKIDEVLGGGLYLSDVLAIVAPPKSAKSALALQLALRMARQMAGECSVGLLSLEMSNLQNALRLIAQESFSQSFESHGDDRDAIASNWLKPGIYESTYKQASAVAASLFLDNFLVCQKPLEWREVQAEARRLARDKNMRVLVVDYWQLIENDKRGMSRADRLADIANGLKMLGQELNIVVIVLGQFNAEGLKKHKEGGDLSALYLEGSSGLLKAANIILTVDIKEGDMHNPYAARKGTLTFKPLRSAADRRLECDFYGRYLTVTNIY
jgi:replicative DNA helicase